MRPVMMTSEQAAFVDELVEALMHAKHPKTSLLMDLSHAFRFSRDVEDQSNVVPIDNFSKRVDTAC